MGENVDEVLETVKEIIWAKSDEESQKNYDAWSGNYDEQLGVVGYQVPRQAAVMFKKHAKDSDVSQVLDVGGGTGLVGQYLRELADYKGEIDILDANMELLYKASKKPIGLRNIIRHWVTDQLPVPDHSYDVVTCIGSFLPKHIPVSSVPAILRAVRSGGLFIFNLRAQSTEGYKVEFDAMIQKFVDEGKLELIGQTEFAHFENTAQNVNSVVFVYKYT